jgi:hypothetical protein
VCHIAPGEGERYLGSRGLFVGGEFWKVKKFPLKEKSNIERGGKM